MFTAKTRRTQGDPDKVVTLLFLTCLSGERTAATAYLWVQGEGERGLCAQGGAPPLGGGMLPQAISCSGQALLAPKSPAPSPSLPS